MTVHYRATAGRDRTPVNVPECGGIAKPGDTETASTAFVSCPRCHDVLDRDLIDVDDHDYYEPLSAQEEADRADRSIPGDGPW